MSSSRGPSRGKPGLEQRASKSASPVESLAELALDLRWVCDHKTDALWAELELWAMTHNPWAVLQTVSRAKLENRLAGARFAFRDIERAFWMMETKENGMLKPLIQFE